MPSKSRPALITRGFGFGFGVVGADESAAEGRPRIRPIRACCEQGRAPAANSETRRRPSDGSTALGAQS